MLNHALHASFADAPDQRSSDRRVLRLEARIATPAGNGGIEVHNLSRSGLLVEGACDVAAGSRIEVELPGGTSRSAEVVWADDNLFGCRFLAPLTKAQLSAALLRSAPLAPSSRVEALTQAEALARLRQHWEIERHEAPVSAAAADLPLGTRMWIIAGLALAAWAVPAAAVLILW